MALKILYEDNHLIAVFKPAGLLVQGDETGDVSLMDEVKAYLKETYHKPGNVFLGLVHRLDRPVGGIVVFAKTSKGASRLSEQFRSHTVEKMYHAVVSGLPKENSGKLVNYLIKNPVKNIVAAYNKPRLGAEKAVLSYEVVSSNGKNTLLKINLETGKPHQIRAQLSHNGHPIVGDVKYGSREPFQDKAIALAATSISFKLATKEEVKYLEIEMPKEWQKYLE